MVKLICCLILVLVVPLLIPTLPISRPFFPSATLPILLRYKVGRAWYKSEECEERSVNDEDVNETKQEESAFKEEERVLHWADGWYPATVVGVTGNGTSDEYTYSLRYEDGDEIDAAKEYDMTKLDEELEKRSFEEHVRTAVLVHVFVLFVFFCSDRFPVILNAESFQMLTLDFCRWSWKIRWS